MMSNDLHAMPAPSRPVAGSFAPSIADFEVDELPRYAPCGAGDHLYVRVEKRGRTTRDLIAHAQRVFGLREVDIGYAGLKDRHATTRQWLSLLNVPTDRAGALDDDAFRVTEASRHGNKLRVGHLAGNRFRVIVRVPDDGDVSAELETAHAWMAQFAARGLINRYGEQRFGAGGRNADDARALLQRGFRGVPPWKARFLCSSLQSELFNAALDERLARGWLDRVLDGDVLEKSENGARFISTEAGDQARFESGEVAITGPIYGHRPHIATTGAAATFEAEVLAAAGLDTDALRAMGRHAEGTRRPYRAPVREVAVTQVEGGLELRFTLPPGAYATVLVSTLLGES